MLATRQLIPQVIVALVAAGLATSPALARPADKGPLVPIVSKCPLGSAHRDTAKCFGSPRIRRRTRKADRAPAVPIVSKCPLGSAHRDSAKCFDPPPVQPLTRPHASSGLDGLSIAIGASAILVLGLIVVILRTGAAPRPPAGPRLT